MMAGCGSDSQSPSLLPFETPSGFRFSSLLEAGAPLPDGRRLADLPRLVQTYDQGVIFQAEDERGRRAIYRSSFQGEVSTILAEGDTVEGDVIRRLSHRGDVNPEGHYAGVVSLENGTEAVVLASPAGVRRVLGFRDTVGEYRFGSAYLSVSLHRNDDLLVATQFGTVRPTRAYQGLFHLPGARRADAQLLLRTGTQAPDSQAVLTALGLVYLGDEGCYVVQAFGPPADGHTTMLLSGRVGAQPVPLVGHPALGVAPRPDFRVGSSMGGSRLQRNTAGYVVHTSPTTSELVVGSQVLQRTGDRTPRGQRAAAFHPPIFGPRGQVFHQCFTGSLEDPASRGAELILNGTFTLLSVGDELGGRRVEDMHFGYLSDQVSSRGMLAFTAQLAGVPALVMGEPV